MKSKDKLIAVVGKIARKENKSPETVVSELNNMSEEQINNKLKMINIFKEGGKLDYLLCLKKGGPVKDCGCGGNIEKKQEGGQTVISPTPVNGKSSLLWQNFLGNIPRINIDGVEHSAVQFPDGTIKQTAYGDGYTSELTHNLKDSSVVRYTNYDGKKKWSNEPGSTNTMKRDLAIRPFKSVTVKNNK